MTIVAFLSLLLLQVSSAQERVGGTGPVPTYKFINGQRFYGEKFVPGVFYSIRGVFSLRPPAHVDSVIDLHGKYVVPPYAEAHNHNIDGFKKVEDRIQRYLAEGIFYIKNPNSIPHRTSTLKGMINIPTSVDVIFSNGGLTSTGGHPMELVRRNIGLGIFTNADAEGGMYYLIDSEKDLRTKWRAILADKPDFIKTYLLYSEEFAKRKDDTTYFGWKGLDPALLPGIVHKAHQAGLRVSTHVETAEDFHNAAVAGVDEINHMPGFRADSTLDFSRYQISPADARLCAARGIIVVTTLASAATSGSAAYQENLRKLHTTNLNLLKKSKVRIAIGSDQYRQTSVVEAMYLNQLDVFTRAELLHLWCDVTAKAIFPKRKIGSLQEGYEASFLVLEGDPLSDFTFTQKILLRIKQGRILNLKN